MSDEPIVETLSIADVAVDPKNANKGTVRGRKLLKQSIRNNGVGRSILLDKNNVAIAGNKSLEEARKAGYKKVIVVDSDGDTLVAVRRTDLDLTKDKKAQQLAIADNRVAELDLDWDPEVLKTTGADIGEMFEPMELDKILHEGGSEGRIEGIDDQPPPKMLWVLLGIPMSRFDAAQEHLAALESESDISVQSARND